MLDSATLNRFNDTLVSMDRNILMQTSFLESIYNMVVPMSVAIENMSNSLSELLNLEKERFEFEKEQEEDVDRERQLRDVEPPPSDTIREEARPADIVEDEKDSGFGLPGIGLKTLLLGAAFGPLVFSFLKGLVQQLLEDWWQRVQDWFDRTLTEFQAWFEGTLNDLKLFLQSLIPPWLRPDPLAGVPLSQRPAAAAQQAEDLGTQADILETRAIAAREEGNTQRANELDEQVRNLREQQAAAIEAGQEAEERIQAERDIAAITAGEFPTFYNETPPISPEPAPPPPIGGFDVGDPATDSISRFLQTQNPGNAPMPGEPLSAEDIVTLRDGYETARNLGTELSSLRAQEDEDPSSTNPTIQTQIRQVEEDIRNLQFPTDDIPINISPVPSVPNPAVVPNPISPLSLNPIVPESRIAAAITPAAFEGSTRIIDRTNVVSQETARLMTDPARVVLVGGNSNVSPINNVDNSQTIINNNTINPLTNMNAIPV